MSVQDPPLPNESALEEEKLTVPAGLDFVPAASTSVTVTETVAAWPAIPGFGDTETLVVVPRLLTCSVRVVVLVWKTPDTPA